jgi:hypothetical protein
MTLIRDQYAALDDKGARSIDPANIAELVYGVIDPRSASPELVRDAAMLQLRAWARVVCAEQHRASEYLLEASQRNLFDFKLQERYPVKRNGEDVYVLRDHMTLEDRQANIKRLLAESDTKKRHALALEAETNQMRIKGKFGKVA